jgi:hypothetical protein
MVGCGLDGQRFALPTPPQPLRQKAGKRKIPSWALISNGFASWSVYKLYRVWIASRSGAVCCDVVTGVETMSVDGTLIPIRRPPFNGIRSLLINIRRASTPTSLIRLRHMSVACGVYNR